MLEAQLISGHRVARDADEAAHIWSMRTGISVALKNAGALLGLRQMTQLLVWLTGSCSQVLCTNMTSLCEVGCRLLAAQSKF